jgi:S-formylglutathione hydrolase FrmB
VAFCELKYFSNALQKQTAADLILPEPKQSGPFSVLYLLHGLSDDHTIWQRRTSIERYVEGLPLIVVMPDTGRGWYTDAVEGMAWESAIVGDLVSYVDGLFHTRADRGGRCLAGLSMGGYGAAKLALRFPDRFVAAVSHSGALAFAHKPIPAEADERWRLERTRIVGENPVGGPNDLYALAAGLAPSDRPALRIDCGTEDFLIEDNREFHAYLDGIGYAHEYAEHPGAHNWAYWDLHIQESLAFLTRHMNIARS